jgi:excisionase family DNA binding protein
MSKKRDRALDETIRQLVAAGLDVTAYDEGPVADFWVSPRASNGAGARAIVKVRGQSPDRTFGEQGLERDVRIAYLRADDEVAPLLWVVLDREGGLVAQWFRSLGRYIMRTMPKPRGPGEPNTKVDYWPLDRFRPIREVVEEWRSNNYGIWSASLLDEPLPETERPSGPGLRTRRARRPRARLLTCREVAALMGTSSETVRQYWHEGVFRGVQRAPGCAIRIWSDSVDEFLDRE